MHFSETARFVAPSQKIIYFMYIHRRVARFAQLHPQNIIILVDSLLS
jgi:hypothetical protein